MVPNYYLEVVKGIVLSPWPYFFLAQCMDLKVVTALRNAGMGLDIYQFLLIRHSPRQNHFVKPHNYTCTLLLFLVVDHQS